MRLLESAICVMSDAALECDRAPRATLVKHLELGVDRPSLLEQREALAERFDELGSQEVPEPRPEHLFAGEAERVEPHLVHLEEAAVFVE